MDALGPAVKLRIHGGEGQEDVLAVGVSWMQEDSLLSRGDGRNEWLPRRLEAYKAGHGGTGDTLDLGVGI